MKNSQLSVTLLLALISLVGSVIVHHLPLFVVPEHQLSKWSKGSPTDLVCPPTGTEPDLKDGDTTTVTISKQQDHVELKGMDGWLCYGLTYITTCDEGFFGGQTYTQEITRHMVTESACKEEIEKVRQGEYAPPTFPEPGCVWNSQNKVMSVYTLINDHHVMVDPYLDVYVDGLFPGKTCKISPCDTVHENTIWISRNNKYAKCSPFLNETALVTFEKQDPSGSLWLRLDDYDFVDISKACIGEYCGQVGLHLTNGAFILWKEEPRKWRQCTPEMKKVEVETTGTTELKMKENFKDAERRMECMMTLLNLRNGMPLSYLALDKFQPDSPGRHMAYRINNGTLEKSLWTYRSIEQFMLEEEGLIGIDADKQAVPWNDWVDSGLNGTLSGFNGVHKVGNKIIIPRIELRKVQYAESIILEHSYVSVEHPDAKQLSHHGLTSDTRYSTSFNRADVADWLGRVWDSLVGKLVIIAVAILTVAVVVGLCCCCGPALFSCCLRCGQCCKRKTDPDVEDGHQMAHYSPGTLTSGRPTRSRREW